MTRARAVALAIAACGCHESGAEIATPTPARLAPPVAVDAALAVAVDAGDEVDADIARIGAGWDGLVDGTRTGLAYPFVAAVDDVHYLAEPACSTIALALDRAQTAVDAESWRCLGAIARAVGAPATRATADGRCCGWSACPERGQPAGVRRYCAFVPVSADDMHVVVDVDARGLRSIHLALQ